MLKSGAALEPTKCGNLLAQEGIPWYPKEPVSLGRPSTPLLFIPSARSFTALTILHSAPNVRKTKDTHGHLQKGEAADSPPRKAKPEVWTHAIHRLIDCGSPNKEPLPRQPEPPRALGYSETLSLSSAFTCV